MIVTMATAIFMAWAIGANDSAKAVGTAVGSGVIGFKRAVLLIGVFTSLGALLAGSGVSGTVSELSRGLTCGGTALVLFSAALSVTVASLWGRPVSTTQSVIGSLVGALLALNLPVEWSRVSTIVLAWVFSPLMAAFLAIAVYRLYRTVMGRIKCLRNLELAQKWLVFLASAYSAFNLGANELSNVVGLIESTGINGPSGLLLALVLTLGALTFSYDVMMTVGKDIAPLGPTSAFSSQFGASIAVSLANLLGFPVSSGQAIVGAIAGLSAYKGEPVNMGVVRDITLSWVRVPLFSAIVSFSLIKLLSASF